MFEVENYLVGDSLTDPELEVIKTEATSTGANSPATKRASSNSTNSGLYHISLACQGVSGSFDIRIGSKNSRKTVVLSIRVPIVIGKPALEQRSLIGSSKLALPTSPDSAAELLPGGLKICMIDDSKVKISLCFFPRSSRI